MLYSFFLWFMAEIMIVLYFFVLQYFVDWIIGNQPLWVGILNMVLFILFTALSIFFRTVFKFEASLLSMKINRGISAVLFQKITRMSQVSLAKASAGKLVTMVSGELQTLESNMWYIFWLNVNLIITLLIFIYFGFAFYEASVIGFVGLITLFFCVLLTTPKLKEWRYYEGKGFIFML